MLPASNWTYQDTRVGERERGDTYILYTYTKYILNICSELCTVHSDRHKQTTRPRNKWYQKWSQYFYMDCLRPACVRVCIRNISNPTKAMYTYIHKCTIISVHTYVQIYVHIEACPHVRTQTHSMLECGEFIQHTAHGLDVTALNSTVQHKKQQLPHKTSLQLEESIMWLHKYGHTYTRTINHL